MSQPVRGRVWVLVILLVVFHFFLHVGMSFGQGAPDLLTVGLLLWARETDLGRAGAMGLGLGLLEDALSAVAFGANSVAMTIVGVGGAFTRDYFVGDSRFFIVSYFWIGKWVRDALHWASVGDSIRPPFVDYVLVQGAVGGAYAAAVGLVLVAITGLGGEAS